MLSLFLRGKECHISIDSFSNVYEVLETREVADNFVYFLSNAMNSCKKSEIKEVVFASGPASFTSVRIINSIVKGLYISDKKIKFVGVSSFLSYLYIARNISKAGILAVPTMRGDFFISEYNDSRLSETRIKNLDELNKHEAPIFFDNDSIFNETNMAVVQIQLLDSDIPAKNKSYISDSLDPEYGFTPSFKF